MTKVELTIIAVFMMIVDLLSLFWRWKMNSMYNECTGGKKRICRLRCLGCKYKKKTKTFGSSCYHPMLFTPKALRDMIYCPKTYIWGKKK